MLHVVVHYFIPSRDESIMSAFNELLSWTSKQYKTTQPGGAKALLLSYVLIYVPHIMALVKWKPQPQLIPAPYGYSVSNTKWIKDLEFMKYMKTGKHSIS